MDTEYYAIWIDVQGIGCTLAENIGEEANARLIASAPDLLEACEEALGEVSTAVAFKIERAIEKATG